MEGRFCILSDFSSLHHILPPMFHMALKRRIYSAVHDSAAVFFLIGKSIISYPVLKVSKLSIQKNEAYRLVACEMYTKKHRI